ncbi:MAG: TlpA disulfide reductase family protein [Actinomycetota bacterium]
MKRQRKVASVSAVFILLATSLSACSSNKAPIEPSVGQVVNCDSISRSSDITGIVLPCLDDSSQIFLDSLRGPLIVNVWGSWCGPCQQEIPFFRDFYVYAKEHLDLLGVDVEEAKPQNGVDFIKTEGMTWPNLFDPDGRTRAYFGAGVPVTWFIDADGKVVYKKIGVLDSLKELKDLTSKYLHITVN